MFSALNYAVLRVFLAIVVLSPARSARDVESKWETADAIASATADVQEEDTLVLIAYLESNFRADVATCKRLGDHGKAFGTFQLHPIERSHARAVCGSPHEQARLALEYVRRSAEACPANVGADRLAMFVSGTCTRGIREARHRWAE